MNTKNIAIAAIVIVLLIILGAGGYFFLNKSSNTSKTTNLTPAPTKAEQTTKSLLDLIALGQNLRCTFSSQITNGSSEGTFYISANKVRGDFKVKTDGKTTQTSMIRTGDENYIWGSNLPTGIKMKISLEELSSNKQASQYIDPKQKVNYSCIPWNVDASLFTPPSNVNFRDMTQFCDSISDATAKAACENALKQSGQ